LAAAGCRQPPPPGSRPVRLSSPAHPSTRKWQPPCGAAGWIDSKAAHSLAVHPTQLYHAAAGALSFLALTRLGDARPGTRLAFALLAYAGSRFVIEFFRGDALPVWRTLDLNQILCIAMIAIGALVWMLRPQNGAEGLRERPA